MTRLLSLGFVTLVALAAGVAAAQPFGAETTAMTPALSDSDSGPYTASVAVTDTLFGTYQGSASSDLTSDTLGASAFVQTDFSGGGFALGVARFWDTFTVSSTYWDDLAPVDFSVSLALDGAIQASTAFPQLDASIELTVNDLTSGDSIFHARGGYIDHLFVAEDGFEASDFDLSTEGVIETAVLSGWTVDVPVTWLVGESHMLEFELRAHAVTCPCALIAGESDFADSFSFQIASADPNVDLARASAVPEPSMTLAVFLTVPLLLRRRLP